MPVLLPKQEIRSPELREQKDRLPQPIFCKPKLLSTSMRSAKSFRYADPMQRHLANNIVAALFLIAAFRDWFFPGWLQIHASASGQATVWFLLGCTLVSPALLALAKGKLLSK